MAALRSPLVRYTRFVGVGKHALWVLAGILTVTLVIVARINAGDEHSRIVLSGTPGKGGSSGGVPANDAATMVRPRYQGIDSKNRPFNIIAERAVQPDSETVLLHTLSMDMTLEDSAWVALTANDGHYHLDDKHLDLDGDVHVYYEGGYEFRTQHAEVDVAAGSAHGEMPVQGQGTGGTLKSDRFTILQHGAIVWFLGNVDVVLYL